MIKISKFLFVILFLGVFSTGLSDIIVTYKSGECRVDLYGNGKWKDVSVNMNLNESSVIKTGDDGEVEIEIDGDRVAIGRDVKVSIGSIVENLRERKKLAWFSKLPSVFRSLVEARSKQKEPTIMGVRGVMEDEGELGWMDYMEEEGPSSRFQNGKEFYNEASYVKAINILKDIIDAEELSLVREEVAFYLGASMFSNMQYKESLRYLLESMKDKNAYYYEVALINTSFAHYFVKDYRGAIDSFETYSQEFSEGNFKPYALLMLGKSHKVIGEKEKAKKYFREIEAGYRDTEVYSDAVNEMRGL